MAEIKLVKKYIGQEQAFKNLKDIFALMFHEYRYETQLVLQNTCVFALKEERIEVLLAPYDSINIETFMNKLMYNHYVLKEKVNHEYYRFLVYQNGKIKAVIHLTTINSRYYNSLLAFERWFKASYQNRNYWNMKMMEYKEKSSGDLAKFHQKVNKLIKQIIITLE